MAYELLSLFPLHGDPAIGIIAGLNFLFRAQGHRRVGDGNEENWEEKSTDTRGPARDSGS